MYCPGVMTADLLYVCLFFFLATGDLFGNFKIEKSFGGRGGLGGLGVLAPADAIAAFAWEVVLIALG